MYTSNGAFGASGIAVCVLGFGYIIGVIVYRLTFHPLAKYPGPLIAKITDWYNIYHCLRGDRHIEFHRIHSKYGKFVRYGPNRLSINSDTALKTIYGVQANVQKSLWYSVWLAFFPAPSSQSMIDVHKYQHAEKRKVIARALTDHSLDLMDDVLLQHTRTFCELLADPEENSSTGGPHDWSNTRNIQPIVRQLTFDVMGDVCFGYSFQMMVNSTNHYVLGAMKQGGRCLYAAGHMPQILKTGIHRWLSPALIRDLEGFIDYVKVHCDRRSARGGSSTYTDVFTAIHGARHPKTGSPTWTQAELESEAALLVLAGSDNTATAMTATLFYLAHNPHALAEAQAEVRRTFSDPEAIRSGDQLSSCQYLRACVDEAMRMCPPAPGLMPRDVLPGGIDVDGHHIPQGTEIGTPIYAIHHEPAYFPAPFTFRPERWIAQASASGTKASGNEEVLLARSAFCAFARGPRDCVGKQMAYREMMIVLANVLWRFEMRLAAGSSLGEGGQGAGAGRERRDEYQLFDFFAAAGSGPELCFKRR